VARQDRRQDALNRTGQSLGERLLRSLNSKLSDALLRRWVGRSVRRPQRTEDHLDPNRLVLRFERFRAAL
jgi:hypothetical protein